MKNKWIVIALATAALGMAGCNDYLDMQPKDRFTDKNFWLSEASLETDAWMLYENFDGYGSGWTMGQYHNSGLSDNYCPEGAPGRLTEVIPSSSNAWKSRYLEIRRANILFNRVERIDLTVEAAGHWRGVARFFRAMKHAELVQTYGDVVWADQEVDIDDNAALTGPREDRALVMRKVCADLQAAGDSLRYSTDNTVNNMCAWALLSRVALFEGAWQKYHKSNNEEAKYFYQVAKDAATKVISSGKYSITPYKVVDAENGYTNYKMNYISKDLSGNKEMILFKVYVYGADLRYAHATAGMSNSSTATKGLTKSAVENFANSNGLPIYLGSYNDRTLEGVFSNRDARLGQIADPNMLCTNSYAYIEGINATTGYWTSKFVDWKDYGQNTWNGPYNDTDAPLLTYPEVLENYAEACAELEDMGAYTVTQNDLDISVNELRINHGNIPGLTVQGKGVVASNGVTITKDPKNDTGINNLLWELRRDRRSELMADGFRWDDLRRWKLGRMIDLKKNPDCYRGVSKAALQEYFERTTGDSVHGDVDWVKATSSNFFEGDYLVAWNLSSVERTFDETRNYLEPIPSTQLTLNPNLGPNNPGWE